MWIIAIAFFWFAIMLTLGRLGNWGRLAKTYRLGFLEPVDGNVYCIPMHSFKMVLLEVSSGISKTGVNKIIINESDICFLMPIFFRPFIQSLKVPIKSISLDNDRSSNDYWVVSIDMQSRFFIPKRHVPDLDGLLLQRME